MKFKLLFYLSLFAAPVLAQADICGCEAGPLPDVIATVNGTKLKAADVFTEETRQRIAELQRSVMDARRSQLEPLINSKLLEAEARKRGMSITRLIKVEVTNKVVEPTAAEVRAYYDRNRETIGGDFAAAEEQIIRFIRQEREQAMAKEFAARLRAAADIKQLVDVATPPVTRPDRDRIFATVNGIPIRSSDVEDILKPTIFVYQSSAYDVRSSALKLKINDILLSAEAKRRGVSDADLFRSEVMSKVQPVTDADAREFFEKNKSRINGEFARLRPQIIEYLADERKKEAEQAFADQLLRSAAVEIFLSRPTEPKYDIDTAGKVFKGAANAPVTIIEFVDVQCRTCAEPHAVLDRIVGEMNGKVRLTVLHFPLSQHAYAQKAAEAAEAAREQGKFWEYLDLLFKNQNALAVPDLKRYASQLGLDRKKFDAALDGTRLEDLVERDRLEGDRVGVYRTPTVFINGRRSVDVTYEGLKRAVESALKLRQ